MPKKGGSTLSEKTPPQRLDKCLECAHSRQYYHTDRQGYNYYEKCECRRFVENLTD
jgi:hypothetical protein